MHDTTPTLPIELALERVAAIAAERAIERFRSFVEIPDEPAVKAIAQSAAREAVVEVLQSLGLDHSKPAELVKDFVFLRSLRERCEAMVRQALMVLLTVVLTGLCGLVWLALRLSK